MNYLLTSTAWRQEHNGYSHQNPSFVSGMLEKHNDFVKAYYPVDDNSMLAIMEEAFGSKNQMNIITAGKTPEPRWLSYEAARSALQDGGVGVFDFASDKNPHIVLVGIGDYVTKELLAAVEIVKTAAPEIRLRVVNILRLQAECSCEDTYHPQIPDAEKYFTIDKPVIVNFHGYPETVQNIFFKLKNPQRFSVHGYREEGGTTTPFDMQVRNQTDRYHLAMEVVTTAVHEGAIEQSQADALVGQWQQALDQHHEYITRVGADPYELENWQWAGKPPIIATMATLPHADIIREAHTIAFIGLSDKPERYSYKVAKYFQEKGYRIIPINPNVAEALGEKSYSSLLDVPRDIHIDIVDIFRKPDEVVEHLHEVVERGNIKTVWLAEGVNSHAAEEFAEDYGLSMVSNLCIMKVDTGTIE